MYSIAAINGKSLSIEWTGVVGTFIFAGILGAIGSKDAASNWNRIKNIESDFVKYVNRDVQRYGSSFTNTVLKRGVKYYKDFIKPFAKSTFIVIGITTIANVAYLWLTGKAN